jgi:hypothetical protein
MWIKAGEVVPYDGVLENIYLTGKQVGDAFLAHVDESNRADIESEIIEIGNALAQNGDFSYVICSFLDGVSAALGYKKQMVADFDAQFNLEGQQHKPL